MNKAAVPTDPNDPTDPRDPTDPTDQITRFDLRHERGVTKHFYGAGALAAGSVALAPELAGRAVFAVSSAPIWALHGERLAALAGSWERLERLEVPDGEAAKSVAEAERLWRRLSTLGARRGSLVVAFGGGSVGDLAGFVAGTFARGLDWLQLPTTFLAQVDAAIGGKSAVDLPEAKNAVGLFHHPLAVLADSELLATLPAEQLRSGLVEVVKIAALLDLDLLAEVERDLERLLSGEPAALGATVARAARTKARLVESDPDECGARKLLNFGHTLGHALEAEIGYGRMLHGDAVAHGLRFAVRLSLLRGADPALGERLTRLLDRLAIPPLPQLSIAGLLERIGRDKKATGGGVEWILLPRAGEALAAAQLPAELVAKELAAFVSSFDATPL